MFSSQSFVHNFSGYLRLKFLVMLSYKGWFMKFQSHELMIIFYLNESPLAKYKTLWMVKIRMSAAD